jgi:tetratricopeptide (TPR) repeat protein
MLKKFFGKSGSTAPVQELSIDDLVVLERYDEAIERLEKKAHDNPNDLHAHLRLAEVLSQVGKGARALDQYLYVADMYTDDGFYDKALALLTKIARLAPTDDSIRQKTARIQRLKDLEHSRVVAIEGLVEAQKHQDPLSRVSPIEVEKLWQGLAQTSIVQRLRGDLLKRLFAACEPWGCERGTVIARAGALDEFLLIVVQGSVEARHETAPGHSYQLRTFFPGDVFGERALLEHLPWPATYTALERSKFVRVNKDGIERAMTGSSDPRALLDALRAQHCDRDVAAAAERVAASGRP